MNISLKDMEARCAENGLKYAVMQAGANARILVLERGGRVFGPFFGDGDGVLWASSAWRDPDEFRRLLADGEWNVGGDRVWIAPEVQFHIQDRTDPENSMRITKAVDPGTYRMKTLPDVCILEQDMKLQAYNLARGTAELHLQKSIRPAANPLHALSGYAELMNGVDYCGYLQELMLRFLKDSAISAEAWNITQIEPPGEILIPVTQEAEYADYYEPVDTQHMQRSDQAVWLKASGKRRYKVGFKAAHVNGDIVYFGETGSTAYLYIKRFFNNPSAPYSEEPASLPGVSGFSTHVYNDDGNIGGFAELECNLQPVSGSGSRESSTDLVCNWFFKGPLQQLDKILLALTGRASDSTGC